MLTAERRKAEEGAITFAASLFFLPIPFHPFQQTYVI
jgi:hypothetical protein